MKINSNGQWSLSGNEDSLLFKTNEKKSSGKNKPIKREFVHPDSDEAKELMKNLAEQVLRDVPKQPTDEQLFGHLVPTEEQVEAAENAYNSCISGFYSQDNLNDIDKLNKSDDTLDFEWGNGRSFNDCLKESLEKKDK